MNSVRDFRTQKKPQFWYSTIQGMVGKLYVLSLYYIMYVLSSVPWTANIDFLMFFLDSEMTIPPRER